MPKKKWITVRVPENTKTYDALEKGNGSTAWKIIEEQFENKPESKQEKVIKEFEKFMDFTEELYPGSKSKIDHLTPIIFNKILKTRDPEVSETYDELPDNYFEILKGLLNNDF